MKHQCETCRYCCYGPLFGDCDGWGLKCLRYQCNVTKNMNPETCDSYWKFVIGELTKLKGSG